MKDLNKLSIAKKYCKLHKLKLEDFNEEGFFIASHIVEIKAFQKSFASKKTVFKRRNFEGFFISSNDCITLKNFGTYINNSIMFFTDKILMDLKTIKN
jgi:hypothetical protein